MAALSAVVFTLSWWLGLYLLARDPRKPVLVLAAIGLTSFASWWRWTPYGVASGLHLAQQRRGLPRHRARHRLVRGAARTVPAAATRGAAAQANDRGRRRWRRCAFFGAAMAGNVEGRCGMGHWVMFAAISLSSLGAMVWAVFGPWQPRPVVGYRRRRHAVLRARQRDPGHPARAGAQLAGAWRPPDSTSPCSASPSRCGTHSTRGRRCARDMLRSFAATGVVAVLFGGQVLIGMA